MVSDTASPLAHTTSTRMREPCGAARWSFAELAASPRISPMQRVRQGAVQQCVLSQMTMSLHRLTYETDLLKCTLYINIYLYTCTYMYVDIYAHIHMCTYAYIYIYIHAPTHASKHEPISGQFPELVFPWELHF